MNISPDVIATASAYRSFIWGSLFPFLLTIFFVCLIPRVLHTVFSGMD